MSLKDYKVTLVDRKEISNFIETHHYSGSINGCISDFCFALYDPNEQIKGAMFYGRMAMRNQYKKFSETEKDVIELRRLCCVDDTPKNAESYFIGKSLRLLKKVWGGKIIVTYADKEHNHCGTIYKASNFTLVGEIPGAKVIKWGDRTFHDKSIRTKYKGQLKPFARKLKEALENGEAVYHKTKGKFTFIYRIRK